MLESGLAGAMLLKMQHYFITIKNVFWVEVCAMQIIDNGQVAWWETQATVSKDLCQQSFQSWLNAKMAGSKELHHL